jgi:hypothetical protein
VVLGWLAHLGHLDWDALVAYDGDRYWIADVGEPADDLEVAREDDAGHRPLGNGVGSN